MPCRPRALNDLAPILNTVWRVKRLIRCPPQGRSVHQEEGMDLRPHLQRTYGAATPTASRDRGQALHPADTGWQQLTNLTNAGSYQKFDRGPHLRALAARPAGASNRAGPHRERLWPSGWASEPQQGHQWHWGRIDTRARAREEAQDGLHRQSWRVKDETLTLKG